MSLVIVEITGILVIHTLYVIRKKKQMDSKRKLVINSYEEFENHLRECIQWDSNAVGQYDIVGITNLLSAILDNLNTNVHPSGYENLREILSNQNIEFLKKLVNEN